jgi:hypothetical protein
MVNLKWGIMTAVTAVIISVGIGFLSGVGILHIFLRALIFAAVFFGFGFGMRFLINSLFPELLLLGEEPSAQEALDQAGSKINIILDNTGEYAVPELYKTPGDSQELGNIDDLISGVFRPRSASDERQSQSGIDRNKEESYNIGSTFQSVSDQENFTFQDTGIQDDGLFDDPPVEKPRAENKRVENTRVEDTRVEDTMPEKPAFTPSFGDDTGVGGLPDLEMFAMAFSGGGESRADMQPMTPTVDIDDEPPEEFEPTQPSHYVASKATPMKGNFDAMQLAKGISTVLSKDK